MKPMDEFVLRKGEEKVEETEPSVPSEEATLNLDDLNQGVHTTSSKKVENESGDEEAQSTSDDTPIVQSREGGTRPPEAVSSVRPGAVAVAGPGAPNGNGEESREAVNDAYDADPDAVLISAVLVEQDSRDERNLPVLVAAVPNKSSKLPWLFAFSVVVVLAAVIILSVILTPRPGPPIPTTSSPQEIFHHLQIRRHLSQLLNQLLTQHPSLLP